MKSLTRPVLLAACLAVVGGDAMAKYVPPRFYDLAGLSDAIILGRIVELDAETFTLRPERILAGRVETENVIVLRFKDWTCSHRWKPYAVGQREIAFLQAAGADDTRMGLAAYRLRSAGDEAEWEVRGDQVSVQGFRIAGGVVYDEGEHPGQWLPLTDVLDALHSYRQCFAVSRGSSGKPWVLQVRLLCDSPVLEAFRNRSTVHEYLAKSSLDASQE